MTRREFFQWAVRGIVLGCVADAYLVEPNWIGWNTFTLESRGKTDTPVTLVQLSDLHLKEISQPLVGIVEKINQLKPDILCLTGDMIDKADNLSLLDAYLGMLDRDIWKVAILGNWEYWGKVDLSALKRMYDKYDIRLLVNDAVLCPVKGKSVLFTGIDDFVGGDPNINAALTHYAENDFHVVLNHCPEYRDVIADVSRNRPWIDVILAGHTHGGQVNIFGFIPVVPPGSGRYIKGWYRGAGPAMYVSRGIGTSLVPFRMMAPPEVTVFQLKI